MWQESGTKALKAVYVCACPPETKTLRSTHVTHTHASHNQIYYNSARIYMNCICIICYYVMHFIVDIYLYIWRTMCSIAAHYQHLTMNLLLLLLPRVAPAWAASDTCVFVAFPCMRILFVSSSYNIFKELCNQLHMMFTQVFFPKKIIM